MEEKRPKFARHQQPSTAVVLITQIQGLADFQQRKFFQLIFLGPELLKAFKTDLKGEEPALISR